MQIVCIIPVEAIMTADLWALVAAMLLAVVQLTLSSVLTLRQLGGARVAGPRDEPREVTGVSGRFVRAHRNLLEIFPQFVAALFLVHAAHAAGSLSTIGAWVFVIARLLYVPAYPFAPYGCTANLLARRTGGDFHDRG